MGNVPITGGNGNIGIYDFAKFLRQRHAVTVLDQNSKASMFTALTRDAAFIAGDILDVDLLANITSGRKIARIVHLASLLGPESGNFLNSSPNLVPKTDFRL